MKWLWYLVPPSIKWLHRCSYTQFSGRGAVTIGAEIPPCGRHVSSNPGTATGNWIRLQVRDRETQKRQLYTDNQTEKTLNAPNQTVCVASEQTQDTTVNADNVSCGPSQTVYVASDPTTEDIMRQHMLVFEDFLSVEKERSLFEEVEPYLKRLRYESSHWDDAIHGYRETELKNWSEENRAILQRVKDIAFPPHTPQLAFTHVLDLQQTGYIKPHIDSVRFCGDTIAGLSLLSAAVMRLVHDKNKNSWADVLLHPRSLYIMTGKVRYEYTHEVLAQEVSTFKGDVVPRDRRISIMCRTESSLTDSDS